MWLCFLAAAYCEMALAAARAVLGEASEVRDIRFEQALLLDEQTTVGASASLSSPGVVDFIVETNQGGEQARQATAVLHAAEDEQPPAYDMSALLAAHPRREDGAEVRKRLDQRGVQYGPAFTGLARRAHRRGEQAGTVLAEVALPGQIRSQQGAYGVHPALLDACFQSVEAHPDGPGPGRRRAGVAVGCPPATLLRFRPQRPLLLHAGDQSRRCRDRGRHRRARRARDGPAERAGAAIGHRSHPRSGRDDRVLAERLLTIEWRQRELPEVEYADAGTWLLISTTATADAVATTLTDALQNHGAQCTTMRWPQHADHTSNAEQLGNHLRAGGFTGVVILTGPKNGDAEDQSPLLGREYVQHLVRITRELPEIPGEPPRLYVVTRNAQTVVAGDVANLEQAGLRGLMRVIGTEHPHLRATQIDVDEATDAEQLARQLLGGSDEDETAWRNGAVVRGAVVPRSAAPRGAANHRGRPSSATGCVCRSARPVIWNRWNSLPAIGFRRGRDRSRSRSARPASTSPTCWSRSAVTPPSRGGCRSWAPISPGW